MRIIVISDTHSQTLPQPLLDDIEQADMIIHVGDFIDLSVLNTFRSRKPVRAVYGNMDDAEVREVLPQTDIFQCEGVKIALFHGEGPAEGLCQRMQQKFKRDHVQAVVFGHSHTPMSEVISGVLYFNPGSPTDMVRSPFRSYGVLEVTGSEIKGRIVKLK